MRIKLIITGMIIVIVTMTFWLIGADHGIKVSTADHPVSQKSTPDLAQQKVPGTVMQAVYEKKKPQSLRITAVGDIMLGRGVAYRLKYTGRDYIYPFEKVVDYLKAGDIVFGNLEEPITNSVRGLVDIDKGGKYVLKNEVNALEGIQYAGFNLLNLANNHILDFYEEGLYETIELLDKNGIAHAGAGRNINEARKPAILERKGIKVGMLSYTDMAEVYYMGDPPLRFMAEAGKAGVAPRYDDSKRVMEDIQSIRNNVDILIISLHWGVEESFEVLKSQREYAYDLLNNGADMILGHHPHQFQGIEIYRGKPIVYSLGNFIFDQNDPENQESFILDMEYTGNRLTSFSAIPVRTVGKTQVVRVTGEEAAELLKREVALSKDLGAECSIRGDRIVFDVTQSE